VCFLILASSFSTHSAPTVGMEGQLEVNLPGTLLEAKPVDLNAPLTLRVADTRPHGTLIAYDFRYVGLEPGHYDLRDYLVRQDGSTTADLPDLKVTVAPLLPEKHDGLLVPQPVPPLPFLGGYKLMMLAMAGVWTALLLPVLLANRKPKPAPQIAPAAKPASLADRLRPLVEQAVQGNLSRDDQALLERLLLNYWRQELKLEELDWAEALRQLRQHPRAGHLLRQLESWLHQPPGTSSVDLGPLLEPYRHVSQPHSSPP